MSEGKRMTAEKRIRRCRRLLSALLAAVMLFAFLPVQSFAAGSKEPEMPDSEIQMYLHSPFYDVDGLQDKTYSGVLAFMDEEIAGMEADSDDAAQMKELRESFVQAYAGSDYAGAPDWYDGSAKKWSKLSGSERVQYIADQYNAAWQAYRDTFGSSASQDERADKRRAEERWQEIYESYRTLDETSTSVPKPDWYYGSNADWNVLSADEVEAYVQEHRDSAAEDGQDMSVWNTAINQMKNDSVWIRQLQQRDIDRGTSMDNTYALTVTTGTNAGTNVLYFGVVYESGSQEYTQFILPHEGDLERSINLAAAIDKNSVREQTIVHDIFGYDVQAADKIAALQPYRTDTYLFQPTHTLDRISRVQVYMAGEKSSTWSCQSLRVYAVDKMYGLASYGYVSDQYYVRFDGTMLARTQEGGFDLNANPSMLFNLPTDNWKQANTVAEEYRLTVPAGDDAVVNSSDQDYVFRLDMADVWGGSLRALTTEVRDNKAELGKLGLPEAMTLSVRYKDTFGAYRDVKIPVVLSALGYAVEQGALTSTSTIAGVAQQGDSLAVAAVLPDLASVSEVKLSLGTQKALNAVGLVDSVPSTRKSERAVAVSAQEDVYLTGVSLYHADDVTVQMNGEGTEIAPSFGGDPLMCYTAQSTQGSGLTPDTDWTVPMTDYSGQKLTSEEKDTRYVVRLTTDDVENAGTIADLNLSLQYRNTAGKDLATDTFHVHQLVNDYYGYWPGSEGGVDFAYRYGAGQGHTLEFQVAIDDVDTFTGFTVGIGSGNDDWQMSRIEIIRLSDRSSRVIAWQNVSTSSRESSDRLITRAAVGETVLMQDVTVFCQQHQNKTVKFGENGGTGSGSGSGTGSGSGSGSGGTVSDADESVDWREAQYSLDYAQACSNFGFTKERVSYTVKVKVASSVSSGSSSQTDDAGSKNLFYFQLVFGDSDGTSGTSGYVLANQQLNADGFRSGMEETFTIRTNRNYGELTAVNIIPDDTSGNSDIYDKLNIESIKVVKNSTSALAKTWVVSDVGWVGIDYKDDGAQTSILGQSARYESQIVRSYLVDSSTYSVNLLFELTTDAYDAKGTNNKDADDPQYQGSVGITLTYRDKSGVLHTVGYDMVDLMYQYAKRTPTKTDSASGVNTNGNAQSDPTYMFRANKTDRFIIPVDSVATLISATLRVNGTVTTAWNIKGLTVSTFSDDGTLSLNSKGEYQRGGTSDLLCADSITAANDENLTARTHYTVQSLIATDTGTGETRGTDQNLIINFAANNLNINEQNETVSCVSRLPQSGNDKVNVYVVPKDNAAPVDLLEGTLRYSLTGNTSQDMRNTFALSRYTNAATGENIYYATGLTASNLKQLSTLSLSNAAGDKQMQEIRIDHAIVQIVRSNVVIGTYWYDFAGLSVFGGQNAEPADTAYMDTGVQEATLNFGANTETTTLSDSKPNIAIALRYTVSYDPSGHVYYSPYVFMTDQEYRSIRSGQSATITFNQPFVGSIEGLLVAGTGDIKAQYESSYVGVYAQNGDAKTLEGYYSLSAGDAVGSNGVHMFRTTEARVKNAAGTLAPCTEHTVKSLQLTFTTPSADTGGDPGTTAPVRAVFYYTDYNGATRSRTVSDLRKYIVSDASGTVASKGNGVTPASGFTAGSTVQVNIPMVGVKEMLRVELEPYGSGGRGSAGASWKPDSMRVRLETDGIEDTAFDKTVQITKRIYENAPSIIYIKDIQLSVEASYPGGNTVQTAKNGEEISGLIEPGQSVAIKAALSGTTEGYTVTAEYRMEQGGAATSASEYVQNDGMGNIVFTAPRRNDTGSIAYYTLKIAYAKDSNIAATVQIHVKKSEPLPEEKPSSSGDGDSGDHTAETPSETPATGE